VAGVTDDRRAALKASVLGEIAPRGSLDPRSRARPDANHAISRSQFKFEALRVRLFRSDKPVRPQQKLDPLSRVENEDHGLLA
jgi:hypothetical protein